jgi:transcription elongation factor Elf1
MRYETHFEKIGMPAGMPFLRCPFCGSENIRAFKDSLFDGESNIGFYCCGCETLFETSYSNIEDAVNYCWNNRAE